MLDRLCLAGNRPGRSLPGQSTRVALLSACRRGKNLRTTRRKHEVHGVSTSTDRVHRRVDGSIVDQPLGCSIGCSASKLNRLDGLVQIEGETAGQVAVGVGLGEEVVGPSLERGDRVSTGREAQRRLLLPC
jgi:hypothetical protein